MDRGAWQATTHGFSKESNTTEQLEHVQTTLRDFPGGPLVKNPCSSAEDADSIPHQGTKILHATGQLSLNTEMKILCATTKTQCSQK